MQERRQPEIIAGLAGIAAGTPTLTTSVDGCGIYRTPGGTAAGDVTVTFPPGYRISYATVSLNGIAALLTGATPNSPAPGQLRIQLSNTSGTAVDGAGVQFIAVGVQT